MNLRQRERLRARIRREMHKQIREQYPNIPPRERRKIINASLEEVAQEVTQEVRCPEPLQIKIPLLAFAKLRVPSR